MVGKPNPEEWLDGHLAAMRAAAKRIVPNRKRMTIDDAQDIVRAEFARRQLHLADGAVMRFARDLHRGPYWPFLHPVQARREGGRFTWRWQRDAD